MPKIAVLDNNMINMIAAGEVIERPASVVKELLENSIDSGAQRIVLEIEAGGTTLISVTDDGSGMDSADLQNAFEQHATSKIKNSDDLFSISTLGFRGEALASIASIAQVKATSKTKDCDTAQSITIDCGSKAPLKPCSGTIGTAIEVRDIFYKLPARRKFLRTANTESSHISEQFIRIALANLDIDLTFISNGKTVYQLAAGQTLTQRISKLFSDEIAESLVEVKTFEDNKTNVKVNGLVSPPGTSRTTNKYQYIFLNGRFIRDKFISHAIKQAYTGCLDPTRYPIVFIFINLPNEDFDVNVHPTKIEVRFYNSNLIHSCIYSTLRQKVLASDVGVTAAIPGNNATPAGSPADAGIRDAMQDFFAKHRPNQSQQSMNFQTSAANRSYNQQRHDFDQSFQSTTATQKFIQIHDSFIVTQTSDGMVIIDQHALHERAIYERLTEKVKAGPLESQKLLIPETMNVTNDQQKITEKYQHLFEKLGIELVNFGPKTIAIQSFPVMLSKASPIEVLTDILDLLAGSNEKMDSQELLKSVLDMAACKAAIKAGQKLTLAEMHDLFAEIEKYPQIGRCPHGRPTMINFSIEQLYKQFKRT